MLNTDDINRRFWEIIDRSYTPQQYTLLLSRCRDLERDIAKQKVDA